jgi:hypothetical protein
LRRAPNRTAAGWTTSSRRKNLAIGYSVRQQPRFEAADNVRNIRGRAILQHKLIYSEWPAVN